MSENPTMSEFDLHAALCTSFLPALPKTKSITVDIPPPEDGLFELGNALESYYPLLEYIFQYLETSDIHSARTISAVWNEVAKRELHKRIAPGFMTCCSHILHRLRFSPNFQYNNASICIFTHCRRRIKMDQCICQHDAPEFGKTMFAKYLNTKIVPKGADYCTIACSAVPPPYYDDKCKRSIYHGLFVPNIPKIRTKMFYYNKHQSDDIRSFMEPNEEVKCLLMFTQKYELRSTFAFLQDVFGCNMGTAAMGGGIIKDTKLFVPTNPWKSPAANDLFCIAFLQQIGEETDFNAYSIVINSRNEIQKYLQFESEVRKFKETAVLRRYGIMFRFCCFAKIPQFKIKETEIIVKHFPNYPMMGLEIDGEIGWNSDNGSPQPKKRKVAAPQPIMHSWSTILVLLTWGKKR